MSRVVVTRLAEAVRSGAMTADLYRRLLTTALGHLTEGDEIETLRATLPRGVVGMKANCLTGKVNSTSPLLAGVLGDMLVRAGWSDRDLVVWERSSQELATAGFVLNAAASGRRCLGTDANGVGYSADLYSMGDVHSLVSRILTDHIGASINLAVLKDHSIAGMSAGLKNMYGAIHNPNKYHANGCDPYCAQVNALEPIKRTQRLTVLDATWVQYQGGPGYIAEFLAWYGGLVVSTDPVAADRVGLRILDHLRQQNGQRPLHEVGRPVRYLETAAGLGLGAADIDSLDLKVLTIAGDGSVRSGGIEE